MAAPTKRYTEKQTIQTAIFHNLVSLFVISCLALASSYTNWSFFHLVNNTLSVIKIYSVTIGFITIISSTLQTRNGKFFIKSAMKNVIKGFLILVTSSFCFHLLAVLYGAPLIESSPETFHFALLLSVTAILPCICTLGLESSHWSRVFVHNSPCLGAETVVQFTTLSSLVGAWLGAFPIPLDWDRPWQVWPISCVIGNLLGYVTGLVISSLYIYHKYNVMRKFKLT